jgi:glycosyltransferase involved in cell wall biosynthesis
MRILLISHKTPPIHGAAIIGDAVLMSVSQHEGIDYQHVNLSINNGKYNRKNSFLKKVYLMLKLYFDIFYQLIVFRPKVIYLTPTLINIGLIRDLMLIIGLKFYLFITSNRSRIIIHIHMRPQLGFVKRCIYWMMLRRTEVILLSNILIKDFGFMKRGFLRVHVLNNFVFTTNRDRINDIIEKRVRRRLNCKEIVVLYIGHMTKSKGLYRALEVARLVSKSMESIVFKFYGEFHQDSDQEYFENYIKKFELGNRVGYYGFCNNEMKSGVYENADIFILTSYSEAFPLVILEAMSYGLMVVANNTGAVSEILSNFGKIVDCTIDEENYLIDFSEQILTSIPLIEINNMTCEVAYIEQNYGYDNFKSGLYKIFLQQ